MDVGETLNATTRDEWRSWLAEHHRGDVDIWLIFYKKSSGKPTIPYNDAVEEAICYGWIDGQMKSIDEERFARRFSPRRNRSNWSKYNKARAGKMLREGKMTQAGLETLPRDIEEEAAG